MIFQRDGVRRRFKGPVGRESGFKGDVDGRLDASSEVIFLVADVDDENLGSLVERRRRLIDEGVVDADSGDVDHVFGGYSRASLAF